MALITTTVDFTARAGTAISGFPTIPVTPAPFIASLCGVYPDNMASLVFPGMSRLWQETAPIRDVDSCNAGRIWTAQDNANVTHETDAGILGGMTRLAGVGVAAGNNGMYGTLDAVLTDYSMLVIARVTTAASNACMINVGPAAASRIMFYVNTSGYLTIQHGSGDIHTSSHQVSDDTWFAVLISYVDSSKAMKMYTTSITPVLDDTMTNSPPSSVLASLLITRENTVELGGEIALPIIWDRALHTDAAALATAVSAMNSIIAL